MLYVAYEINSLPLFFNIGLEICDLMIGLNMSEHAAIILVSLFQQAKDLSLVVIIIDVLRKLSNLAEKIRQTESAIRFETKIVEYCWFLKDTVKECQAYERIGYLNYLVGNLARAKRFHQKSVEGQIEPLDSSMRNGCIEYLQREIFRSRKLIKNYNMTWMCVSFWGLTNDFFDYSRLILNSPKRFEKISKHYSSY